VGTDLDEVLRLLDSLQLTARHAVATPVNWTPGEDVIIPAAVLDEDARKKYPAAARTRCGVGAIRRASGISARLAWFFL
jgi:hypothetical protein